MFKNLRLKPVQRLIMEELMKYGKKGFAIITQERLAENLGVCRHTILRNLLKLEKIKFNGSPLVSRIQRRKKDGTYEVTIYVLEWMEAYQNATKIENQAIVDGLIAEYYQELEGSHVTKRHDLLTVTNKIKNTVNELANKLELKPSQIIRCLGNISYMLSENTYIYHLDKYIEKTFNKMGVKLKAEDAIKELYPALIQLI